MSTSRNKTRNPTLILGGEPRADLLPPEVHLRAKARSTRRTLAFFVVFAVVVAGAGYGFAFARAIQAQESLADAQAQTLVLLAEQSKYSETIRVGGLVEMSKRSRVAALSNEVDWPALIDEINGYLPSGASVGALTLTARVPWEEPLQPIGPLRSPRVATAILVLESKKLLDSTEVIRQLALMEGFADASIDVVERSDLIFKTTITLNLSEAVLFDRFALDTGATE